MNIDEGTLTIEITLPDGHHREGRLTMAFDWDADPIMRISADYRANGMQRSVIGFVEDGPHAGKWALEEFNVGVQFDPHSTTDRFAITYFNNASEARVASDERGYR